MRSVTLFQVDAFTDKAFMGNPAGVVLDAEGLTDAEMQLLARELNNSETTFVLPPVGADHDMVVRFFTPKCEVPVGGHATIATHHILWQQGRMNGRNESRQKCGAGILRIHFEEHKEGRMVLMDQAPPVFGPELSAT